MLRPCSGSWTRRRPASSVKASEREERESVKSVERGSVKWVRAYRVPWHALALDALTLLTLSRS
jgi:hypothetical protein